MIHAHVFTERNEWTYVVLALGRRRVGFYLNRPSYHLWQTRRSDHSDGR